MLHQIELTRSRFHRQTLRNSGRGEGKEVNGLSFRPIFAQTEYVPHIRKSGTETIKVVGKVNDDDDDNMTTMITKLG